ncbi:MAG TPA: flagellar basal body rod protein FlgC [Patescibacteria group bacterium]|nr:flagellar basal body rod protein FlgC [Patescibacteria group bacterium]
MADTIFSTFDMSAQALNVQRQRLSAVANNIANANTSKTENGKPYQREVVVVNGKNRNTFEQAFQKQITLAGTSAGHGGNIQEPGGDGRSKRILSATVQNDNTGERLVHDPSHPDADEDGYVHLPNINVVTEMVEMIAAQRSFEANTSVVSAAKNMARDSMEI